MWNRGGGTRTASLALKSRGSSKTAWVPSFHGALKPRRGEARELALGHVVPVVARDLPVRVERTLEVELHGRGPVRACDHRGRTVGMPAVADADGGRPVALDGDDDDAVVHRLAPRELRSADETEVVAGAAAHPSRAGPGLLQRAADHRRRVTGERVGQ